DPSALSPLCGDGVADPSALSPLCEVAGPDPSALSPLCGDAGLGGFGSRPGGLRSRPFGAAPPLGAASSGPSGSGTSALIGRSAATRAESYSPFDSLVG